MPYPSDNLYPGNNGSPAVRFTFIDSTTKGEINGVYVTGDITSADNDIELQTFLNYGTYSVTCTATGYQDKTLPFTIASTNEIVEVFMNPTAAITEKGSTVIKDILTSEWTAAYTDGRTPTIDYISNYKRVDLRDGDYVLIYKASGTARGMGYTGVEYSDRITIECRSVYSTSSTTYQQHGQVMEDEVLRIIEGKKTRPADDAIWDSLEPIAPLNFDDKGRLTARRVIDVMLLKIKEVTAI